MVYGGDYRKHPELARATYARAGSRPGSATVPALHHRLDPPAWLPLLSQPGASPPRHRRSLGAGRQRRILAALIPGAELHLLYRGHLLVLTRWRRSRPPSCGFGKPSRRLPPPSSRWGDLTGRRRPSPPFPMTKEADAGRSTWRASLSWNGRSGSLARRSRRSIGGRTGRSRDPGGRCRSRPNRRGRKRPGSSCGIATVRSHATGVHSSGGALQGSRTGLPWRLE